MRHHRVRHHYLEKRGGSSSDAGGGTGASTGRIARFRQLVRDQASALGSRVAGDRGASVAQTLADAVLTEDMVVNTGGTLGSIIGGRVAGPVGALAGDFLGAAVTRQVLTMRTVGIEAANVMRNRQDFQRASRAQKIRMMSAEIKRQLKLRKESLIDENLGDISGFAIGNLSASLLNSVPGIGGIPLKGAVVASLAVPKVVEARRRITNLFGNRTPALNPA